MEWWPVAVLALAWLIAPFIALFQIGRVRRELRELRVRLVAIEPAPARPFAPGVSTDVPREVPGVSFAMRDPGPAPTASASAPMDASSSHSRRCGAMARLTSSSSPSNSWRSSRPSSLDPR